MRILFLFFYLLFNTMISAQGGSLDLTFAAGTGTGNYVGCIALQKDSKILIGGQFHTYNGAAVKPIVRLFSNGALDVSFNAEVLDNFVVRSIAVQENGKILVCGQYKFTSNNDPRGKYFFRLNEDGTVDNTFNMGTGADFETNVILLQPDGKILLGGDFTGFNGVARRSIARLNEDGSLDLNFVPGISNNTRILALALQADGKIVIGKSAGFIPTSSHYYYYRINADGTKDLSFREGLVAYTAVNSILAQNDGKILIGGDRKLVRLNSDGNLDSTFTTSYSESVLAIVQQADGKYIIGGGSKNYLVRLNNDGSNDPSFLTNAISGPFVFTLLQQPDKKILVGGAIKYNNNNSTNGIARILSGDEIMSSIENVKSKFLIYPNPVRDILNIKTDNPVSSYRIYSLDGRKLIEENKLNNSKIDVSNLTKGNYLIKFQTKGKEQTTKFIKE